VVGFVEGIETDDVDSDISPFVAQGSLADRAHLGARCVGPVQRHSEVNPPVLGSKDCVELFCITGAIM
jgi:hypothetical protein